ncbi:hypothetical protein ACVWY3_002215 [Bradyrhizobium sp. USDA 4486]
MSGRDAAGPSSFKALYGAVAPQRERLGMTVMERWSLRSR